MSEVDHAIALALLQRLRKRELITEETYLSAIRSPLFDNHNFISKPELKSVSEINEKENLNHADNPLAP